MRLKDAVGQFGEQVAVDHLITAGLTIIERNWRCPGGEVDVIARDGDQLVFVEVKTRSTSAFGSPVEAVNHVKAARVRRLAARWLDEHRSEVACGVIVRFDVVGVVRRDRGAPEVVHLAGAF